MIREARMVMRRADLVRSVAEWPAATGETVSWALVFVNEIPTGGDLRAVREAGKICDRVAVVRLSADKVVAPGFDKVVGEAGADVVWVSRAVEGEVRVEGVAVGSVEATLMVQALLGVLPNAIVVARAEAMWVKAIGQVAAGLGDLGPVRMVE